MTSRIHAPKGKIDQVALLSSAVDHSANEASKPEAPDEVHSAIDIAVTRILAAVLEDPSFGFDDDFFEWGGDSLSVARAVARIRVEFGVELSIHEVLEHPKPRHLADVVRQLLAAKR